MRFSYNRLWKILIDRRLKKKDLASMSGLTGTTIAKLGRGEPVRMDVLGRICLALEVQVGEIVEVEF